MTSKLTKKEMVEYLQCELQVLKLTYIDLETEQRNKGLLFNKHEELTQARDKYYYFHMICNDLGIVQEEPHTMKKIEGHYVGKHPELERVLGGRGEDRMRDIQKAARDIQNRSELDINTYLTEGKYTKVELLEIAATLGFKISSSNTKDNIIIMLAKNLGFKDLTRRIFQRPRR